MLVTSFDEFQNKATVKSVQAAQELISKGHDDAFVVMNLDVVRGQLARWREHLPRVDAWYAVKCCPDPGLMQALAKEGCGFDVASAAELEAVQALEGLTAPVEMSRIIYANPAKAPKQIRAVMNGGVKMTTFDNIDEMQKVFKIAPDAKLVVRILGDDSSSVCRFNAKFGVAVDELAPILRAAKTMGANVMGVSFHVGSGCRNADAFVGAVEAARAAFDLFVECGLPEPKFLDLGGGWPGRLLGEAGLKGEISFEEIAVKLAPALDRLFASDVQIIAEPGRFFAHSSAMVFVNVSSRRAVFDPDAAPPMQGSHSSNSGASSDDEEGEAADVVTSTPKRVRLHAPTPPPIDESSVTGYRLYVNDGVYGSFNAAMYDHRSPEELEPICVLKDDGAILNPSPARYETSIWGPTCDGIDCVNRCVLLPKIELGQWLVFGNMGAYTSAAASRFNGFAPPTTIYV